MQGVSYKGGFVQGVTPCPLHTFHVSRVFTLTLLLAVLFTRVMTLTNIDSIKEIRLLIHLILLFFHQLPQENSFITTA